MVQRTRTPSACICSPAGGHSTFPRQTLPSGHILIPHHMHKSLNSASSSDDAAADIYFGPPGTAQHTASPTTTETTLPMGLILPPLCAMACGCASAGAVKSHRPFQTKTRTHTSGLYVR